MLKPVTADSRTEFLENSHYPLIRDSYLISIENIVDIFAVVSVVRKGDSSRPTEYRIAFAMKGGSKKVEPYLPSPPVFEAGHGFVDYFLTKCKVNFHFLRIFFRVFCL